MYAFSAKMKRMTGTGVKKHVPLLQIMYAGIIKKCSINPDVA